MYKVELNTARNCLRYVIRAFNIKEIYIPFYTCPVVWQSLQKENCKIRFYHIDENFMPVIDFPEKAFILYTNYFGICAKNVKLLCKKYKNIIIDNAQAFYMPQKGIASFYSARKFLHVSDGGILYTEKNLQTEFKKADSYKKTVNDKEIGFNIYMGNENFLNNQDIMYMPENTKTVINNTDIEEIKKQRISNFNFLNEILKETNKLKIALDEDDVPMYYPYLNFNIEFEKELAKNGIYVEHLWNKQPNNTIEGIFQKHLMLLPVDQNQTKVLINFLNGNKIMFNV